MTSREAAYYKEDVPLSRVREMWAEHGAKPWGYADREWTATPGEVLEMASSEVLAARSPVRVVIHPDVVLALDAPEPGEDPVPIVIESFSRRPWARTAQKSISYRRTAQFDPTVYHGSREPDLDELQSFTPSYAGGIGSGVYVDFNPEVARFYGPYVYELRLKIPEEQILWLTPETIDYSLSEHLPNSVLVGEMVLPFAFDIRGQRYSVVSDEQEAQRTLAVQEMRNALHEHGDVWQQLGDYMLRADRWFDVDDAYEYLADVLGSTEETEDGIAAAEAKAREMAEWYEGLADQVWANAEKQLGLAIDLADIGTEAEHLGYRAVYLEGVRGYSSVNSELLVFDPNDLEMIRRTAAIVEDAQLQHYEDRYAARTASDDVALGLVFETEQDPWALAKQVGIGIDSTKDFKAGFETDGQLVAALFTAADEECYAFDIVVAPENQGSGLGSKLMDLAIADYEELREPFPDMRFCLDAVNPQAVLMLQSRGFEIERTVGDHTYLTRTAGLIDKLQHKHKGFEREISLMNAAFTNADVARRYLPWMATQVARRGAAREAVEDAVLQLARSAPEQDVNSFESLEALQTWLSSRHAATIEVTASDEQTFRLKIPVSNLWKLNRWGHPLSPDRLQYQREHSNEMPPLEVQLMPSYVQQSPDWVHVDDPQREDEDASWTHEPKDLDPRHPSYSLQDGHHRLTVLREQGVDFVDAIVRVPEVPHYIKDPDVRAQYERELQDGLAKLQALTTPKTASDDPPALYHGTCEASAKALMMKGWQPNSGSSGSNMGQARYLYVSTVPEDALWFAEQKGCSSVLEISGVSWAALRPDPEDAMDPRRPAREEVAAAQRLRLPAKLVITQPVASTQFHLVPMAGSTGTDEFDDLEYEASLLTVTASDEPQLDFRRGDCAVLALRLAELTGLPMTGLYRGAELHHVAVKVGENILDVDRLSSPQRRAEQFGGGEWREVQEAEVISGGLPGWTGYDEDELDLVDEIAEGLVSEGITRQASDDPPVRRLEWRGMPVSIEVEPGGVRYPGGEFETFVPASWRGGYGYFEDVLAEDGDSLDVIWGPIDGPEAENGPVFVAAQSTPEGDFTQFKVMVHFADAASAEAGFKMLWPESMFIGIEEVPADLFVSAVLPKLEVVDTADDESIEVTASDLTKEALGTWSAEVKARLGLEQFNVFLRADGDTLELADLKVPKDQRKQGIGTQAMKELSAFADTHGLRVYLQPGTKDPTHGTTSKSRLTRFYKNFDFVENKGRNKDFTLSPGMYRNPKTAQRVPVEPWKLTFREYIDAINPDGKSHPSSAYDGWRARPFFDRPSTLVDEVELPDGRVVEIRRSDEAVQMTDGSVERERALYAVLDGWIVGTVQDEWGATLVLVDPDFRSAGLGSRLLFHSRREWPSRSSGGLTPQGYDANRKVHQMFVADALARGEDVPKDVLAEYPDIAPSRVPDSVAPEGEPQTWKAPPSGSIGAMKPVEELDSWTRRDIDSGAWPNLRVDEHTFRYGHPLSEVWAAMGKPLEVGKTEHEDRSPSYWYKWPNGKPTYQETLDFLHSRGLKPDKHQQYQWYAPQLEPSGPMPPRGLMSQTKDAATFDGFDLFDVEVEDDDVERLPEFARGDRFQVDGKGPVWEVTLAQGGGGEVRRTTQKKVFGYLRSGEEVWIYPVDGTGARTGPDLIVGKIILAKAASRAV